MGLSIKAARVAAKVNKTIDTANTMEAVADVASSASNGDLNVAGVAEIGLQVAGLKNKSGKLNKSQKDINEEYVRVRHYTSRKGGKGIESDEVIKAKDNNRVYVESAKKKPLSKVKAEDKHKIAEGNGRDYVETDVEVSRIEMVKNPLTGKKEMTVKGDLGLKNAEIKRRK